ncbi:MULTISPECIES: site-2 protease family protein [Maritimibacter]|uniref:site-2 protease family protein n=1 Tax=Maritimibacter TaxID=404235 RepID=UPI001109B0C2|nr:MULTISPECIES: site-2 protease family protein [Maritimibacter]MBL6429539.1 site-2 protease family protein [Maritimibacter sp.]
MRWSFPIGRLLGSELRVHATFLILLAYVGGSAYSFGGLDAALVNVAYVLALFACVIAHEYGHALTARRFGIPTPDITLLPIGGVARLMRIPEKPGQEVLVALAGPAVNVVIFFVLWITAGLSFEAAPLTGGMTFADLPRELATLNLILAAFNMIPAFPMDGGRVLRATLAMVTDRVKATRIAAGVGQVLAVGFGIYGFYIGSFIYPLIAVFIFMAARAEARDVRLRAMAKTETAGNVMATGFKALGTSLTLEQAREAFDRERVAEFPVVDSASRRITGLLARKQLDDQYHTLGAQAPITRVMATNVPVVQDATPLAHVLRLLNSAPAVAVTDATGEVAGYISHRTVMDRLGR